MMNQTSFKLRMMCAASALALMAIPVSCGMNDRNTASNGVNENGIYDGSNRDNLLDRAGQVIDDTGDAIEQGADRVERGLDEIDDGMTNNATTSTTYATNTTMTTTTTTRSAAAKR